MKIGCVQMNMALGQPQENFLLAARLIEEAMAQAPDVLVLPECWNSGFSPAAGLEALCDSHGRQVKEIIGALAKKHKVNIVAGSVANIREGRVYNTAYVFDREGNCIASYDKTHLFSPMEEHRHFTPGNRLCRFTLDGIPCGLILCYDLRFPELSRSLALQGMDVLFVPAQWPAARHSQLHTLLAARAIENQCYTVCCNSCGSTPDTVFGGNSVIFAPSGQSLALAGAHQQLLFADCPQEDLNIIRSAIPVFRDRQPELYKNL